MTRSAITPERARRPALARPAAALLLTAVMAACSGDTPPDDVNAEADMDVPTMGAGNPSRLAELLADGQSVFGIFSGDHTEAQGRVMAANREIDFVFYSLEDGPFDIPAMEAYVRGMESAGVEGGAHPVALRIPPVGEDEEAARDHIRQGLEAGVDALVYPHVENAADAALAIQAMGADTWPGDPSGSLINVMIIEDQEGIAHAEEIVTTPGVSVAIPGPGDLRRSYEGDMEAVENAIQKVLALCLEHDVPCGITAGVDDIARRLEEGFRMIIVTDPAALAVGREAAGR